MHNFNALRIINELSVSDTYERAVEKRDNAVDTSTIFDSDVTMNEEEYRTQLKGRRRKYARVRRVSSAKQEVTDGTQMPLKKKKSKNPLPKIPSELHSQESIFILFIDYLL